MTVAFRAHALPGQEGDAFNRLIEQLQRVIFPPQPPKQAAQSPLGEPF